MKKEAQTSSVPIDKIAEVGYSNMIVQEQMADSIPKLPNIKTLKNTLSKQRRKVRPPLPKRLEHLPHTIPIQYTMTKRGDTFLFYDGQLGTKRGLVFASENDLSYLIKQKHWYCDGTFYTSPSIFYQIYSIHAYDEGLSSPCVFALLADKLETTYQAFFIMLFNTMNKFRSQIQLETVTIDFELAVKNTFAKNFPTVQVKGCLFHYGQALFRKFTNLELRTAFQNDDRLRVWFRSFAAIALLPENEFDDAVQALSSNTPDTYENEIHSFLQYHESTYGKNSNFPPSMYNHYRNLNPRTINHLEGQHNRWKKRSLKPHDDIYRCIDMIKNEQVVANDQRERCDAGEAPPKRKKKSYC
ncbi:unnamed protein product [Adineta ricciae]|uniref:MULE transposase domain-containing protein n=1 Tax=Adineta ricciae TaxID=249248 RepID=A0A815RFY2_ADIRI|nr:unnamed protein product [Adineta ricciae]